MELKETTHIKASKIMGAKYVVLWQKVEANSMNITTLTTLQCYAPYANSNLAL